MRAFGFVLAAIALFLCLLAGLAYASLVITGDATTLRSPAAFVAAMVGAPRLLLVLTFVSASLAAGIMTGYLFDGLDMLVDAVEGRFAYRAAQVAHAGIGVFALTLILSIFVTAAFGAVVLGLAATAVAGGL